MADNKSVRDGRAKLKLTSMILQKWNMFIKDSRLSHEEVRDAIKSKGPARKQ